MKIAIFTQPAHMNYGGIIQNWALHKVLIRMGHDPVTISRWHDEPPVTICVFVIRCMVNARNFIRRFVKGRRNFTFCWPWRRVFSTTGPRYVDRSFVESIRRTPVIYSDEELRQVVGKGGYDAFIVGSDQVWRQEYSTHIQNYFLDFLNDDDNSPKVAYAASFGTEQCDIDREYLEECKALLSRFDAVSVREDGGVRIARELFKRGDAVKVLDPTLLLKSEDYITLLPALRKRVDHTSVTSQHIAAYILDKDLFKEKVLSDIESSLGLESRRMSTEYEGHRMPCVEEWLSNFACANFVITDSFHGCVFAITFRKPFIAIGNAYRGLDRFTSLLSMLGLDNRMVMNWEEYQNRKAELLLPVDWERIEKILSTERARSMEFLSKHFHTRIE